MFKAGATFRDKNRIKKFHKQGLSAGQISSIVRIKPEQVEAITKQVDKGTLKTSGNDRQSGGDYGEGESATAAKSAPTTKTKTAKPNSKKSAA